MDQRILIVGAGIGGLTLAAALRRRGFSPRVVERAPQWAPVGAGIVLGVNALNVLDELGLAEGVLARGRRVTLGRITDWKGRVLASTDFSRLPDTVGALVAIHRAKLHEALLEGNDAESIGLGLTITDIAEEADGVRVKFSDDSEDTFDLVIGADGIYSKVRELVFGEIPVRYSGYTCWRLVADISNGIEETREMWGPGRRFGIVPISDSTVYCFATLNAPPRSPEMAGIGVDKFRELYEGFADPVPDILDSLRRGNGQLIHNDLEEVQLNSWVKGRVALLGDAAHALTPNMGQGAAMAIEDAAVLAECLEREPGVAGLAAYETRRRARVDKIQGMSWNIGRVAQWESGPGRALRDGLLKLYPDSLALSALKRVLLQPI